MNLPPYVFDVDHVAKIRSELSITVLEKKIHKIPAEKSGALFLKRSFSDGLLFGDGGHHRISRSDKKYPTSKIYQFAN